MEMIDFINFLKIFFLQSSSGVYYRVLDVYKEFENYLGANKTVPADIAISQALKSFNHSDSTLQSFLTDLKAFKTQLYYSKLYVSEMNPLLVVQVTWNNMIHQDDPTPVCSMLSSLCLIAL